MVPAIHLAADVKALLGEGPVWVPRESALLWVDIKGRRLFRLDDAGLREWPTPVRVGSIAPRQGGVYIAGTDMGFYSIELTGGEPRFTPLFDPEADLPDNRFNDGKVDRLGRFWAGTMDDSERQSLGSLYRLDSPDRWSKIDEGYAVTNGPAFSPAGDILYHTDSARRTIYRFDLAPDGSVGPRSVFAHFTGAEGYPDGMTVDTDGCLWVAFWDGWAVRRFSPEGAEMCAIEVPVQRPTSVAFGGPALDRLYITSARIGLDQTALAVQPSAGGLFMTEPGCTGIAERPFAG
ncbi:MAG: SMP-30/gluconolactonase/LRE family protein [Sphingomicrobium sp.]|nr:SMP-30/gluconolactonase/LRE family protein [Sphingomonadales bacterium]